MTYRPLVTVLHEHARPGWLKFEDGIRLPLDGGGDVTFTVPENSSNLKARAVDTLTKDEHDELMAQLTCLAVLTTWDLA